MFVSFSSSWWLAHAKNLVQIGHFSPRECRKQSTTPYRGFPPCTIFPIQISEKYSAAMHYSSFGSPCCLCVVLWKVYLWEVPQWQLAAGSHQTGLGTITDGEEHSTIVIIVIVIVIVIVIDIVIETIIIVIITIIIIGTITVGDQNSSASTRPIVIIVVVKTKSNQIKDRCDHGRGPKIFWGDQNTQLLRLTVVERGPTFFLALLYQNESSDIETNAPGKGRIQKPKSRNLSAQQP